MTQTQWIQRQANLPRGYSPAEATFNHPSGATATLHREPCGSWRASTIHDPANDEQLFVSWDAAMDGLRRCGYRVPASPERATTYANRLRATQAWSTRGGLGV